MNKKSSRAQQETEEPQADKYGSTILGFIVVLILGIFLFNVFRNTSDTETSTGEVTETAEHTESSEQPTNNPEQGKSYTIAPGDDLWNIAVQAYGDGFKWEQIAQANNITNPDIIEEGQVLTIPRTEPADAPANGTDVVAGAHDETTVPENPTQELPTDVTVQRGDTLWSIAHIVYGDGFQWTKIAEANSIANPNIIEPGTLLQIPQ